MKLGGYRVELQEVEQAVLGHHDVLDCRVEVEDLDIGQRLVCFVRLTQDGADFQDIRQSVGARLPQYMVPARWVSPESWPTTVNGKIDVAALLAAHPAADPATPVPHARSEDDLSRVIAAWCSVLSLPDAGVDDNLFEVGGNSLRAALIAMRLQRATGVELSVVNVLANPSPRSLADLITAKRASRPGAERPQLQAVAAARLETHPSHAAR
ncbi:phosphopantetheine-binding protein [Streptomyces sp. NPDC003483]